MKTCLVYEYLRNNVCKNCKCTRCSSCSKYRKGGLKELAYREICKKYNIYELYKENSALSVAEILNKQENTNLFNNYTIMDAIKYSGYKLRSIKESTNLKSTRQKTEATNIERFGAINPLSRGTKAFEKRNNTVKEKYGVDNVFQVKEVKKKIVESTFEHFGCYSQAAPEVHEKTKKTMQDKFGCWSYHQDFALAKNLEVQKGNHNWISKPDLKVQEFLKENNINFEIEKTFVNMKNSTRKWAIVDILVGNIAFEIQGTYWHADPKVYIDSDIVHHNLTAKNIWDRDQERKEFLESFGLKVIYLWQNDILYNFEKISHIILNEVNNES